MVDLNGASGDPLYDLIDLHLRVLRVLRGRFRSSLPANQPPGNGVSAKTPADSIQGLLQLFASALPGFFPGEQGQLPEGHGELGEFQHQAANGYTTPVQVLEGEP
jgi:hypothetical protein